MFHHEYFPAQFTLTANSNSFLQIITVYLIAKYMQSEGNIVMTSRSMKMVSRLICELCAYCIFLSHFSLEQSKLAHFKDANSLCKG